MSATTGRRVTRRDLTEAVGADDVLVTEAPVEFRLGSTPVAVVMATPGDEVDLATGFAITEGIVLGPHEIAGVEARSDDGRYEIVLADGVIVDPEQFRRNLYATSSCGVCGKASIDAVRVAAPPLPDGPTLTDAGLAAMVERLAAGQTVFAETGGLHGAALFDAGGGLLALREDIGRHNAVDKVIGAVAASRWPIGPSVLVVSGRVGFEIVQKAAVAGIPIVAGVSAASSLAVELGEETGMTVVGFARDGSSTVYTGGHRFD